MSVDNLKMALSFINRGFSVIPVRERDKKPLISWKKFSSEKASKQMVKEWYKQYPSMNLGIVTGKVSGIFVLDIDGEKGAESFRQLTEENGQLAKTLTVTTGNGRHLYFKLPNEELPKTSAGKLGLGLDIRSEGGYVVAPGSVHPSGFVYKLEDPQVEVMEAPKWLTDRILGNISAPANSNVLPTKRKCTKDSALNRYGSSALEKTCQSIADAQEGSRNEKLNKAAFRMGQLVASGALNKAVVEDSLLTAALESGLEIKEVCKTIQSALKAGLKEPRDLSHIGKKAAPVFKFETITAAALINKEFEPSKWAIENLLPEGLTIFGGRPKTGKSWLAFDWAISVAMGSDVLGKFKAQKGAVLYLALEDSEKRLQARLSKLLAGDEAPKELEFSCEIPKYDETGLEVLRKWIKAHPDCRLIIIDTLRRYIKGQKKSGDSYDFDTEMLGGLQEFAQKLGIAIVVIHHTRKTAAEDPMDEILGSTGLTGVADAILVLKKKGRGTYAMLHTAGRDFEDDEIPLEFDPDTCKWLLNEDQISASRRVILDFLSEVPSATPKQIAEGTLQDYESLKKLLRSMIPSGLIKNPRRGIYCLPSSPTTENKGSERLFIGSDKNNHTSLTPYRSKGTREKLCKSDTKEKKLSPPTYSRDKGIGNIVRIDLSKVKKPSWA